MNRKLLAMVLVLMMATAVLSSCSLFTSGDDNNGGVSGSTGDVKMTEKYTFTDPADLQFETRYVLYCDENSKMVATAANYGMRKMYSILYADGKDAPVAYYEFMVCDTPENAQAVIDLYASMGTSLTVSEADPCVIYSSTDADTMEAMLISFQASGVLSDTTVSAYLEYYKTFTGGTIME